MWMPFSEQTTISFGPWRTSAALGSAYFPIRFPEADAFLESRFLSSSFFQKLAFRCNFK
jgi:hypothetical protein